MNKRIKSHVLLKITGLLLILFLIVGCAGNTLPNFVISEIDWEHFDTLAENFTVAFFEGDFNRAKNMFGNDLRRALSISALQSIRTDITNQAGAFDSIININSFIVDELVVCDINLLHQTTGVLLRVAFAINDEMMGFFIIDYPKIPDFAGMSTEPIRRDGFTDHPVIIGESTNFPLAGILSIPDDHEAPVPAVIIVHGSGPSDMDGVPSALPNFPNKPFRDIADHLASNGIAVLRYDKRTHIYSARLPQGSTVWEETIEDALLATEMLRDDPRINGNLIFIIGHSLGGMLAPRIHAEGGDFAGLILLAGSPRFLLDISRDQNIDYVNANMEGQEKEDALASLTEEFWYEHVTEPIKIIPPQDAKRMLSGFGTSVYYLQDLYNHPAENYIRSVNQPFLILQGAADFQVTEERDFNLYKEIFADRTDAKFILYPGLNHLFMTSTTGTVDEYEIPGHVDNRVLTDITEWIKLNTN